MQTYEFIQDYQANIDGYDLDVAKGEKIKGNLDTETNMVCVQSTDHSDISVRIPIEVLKEVDEAETPATPLTEQKKQEIDKWVDDTLFKLHLNDKGKGLLIGFGLGILTAIIIKAIA